MPNLILIRGLPGTGKSTFAHELIARSRKNVYLLETDQFFTSARTCDAHGRPVLDYKFDRRLLGAAHDMCYGQAMHALFNGWDVIVANNFVTRREVDRYMQGVQRSGLDVKIDIVAMQDAGLFQSTHNVPQSAIDRMRSRWEDYPGEVTHTPVVRSTYEGEA